MTPATLLARFLALLTLLASTVVVAFPATADPVVRVRGTDRITTSVAVARTGWASADHVLIATAYDYPDAVAAAAYAAREDAPVLLTEPDGLPQSVADVIGHLGARRATVLGGPNAVSDAVVADLAAQGVVVDRISGANRWKTAVAIADRVVSGASPDVVAVALGDRVDGKDAWPDALAAASLAGMDEPVATLLTRRGDLPDETREALQRYRPTKVLLLGGTAAIPDGVAAEIRELGITVERLDGPNRFATAVSVADAAMDGGDGHGSLDGNQVVLVSGEGFADALGAGALAARRSAPLLLAPQAVLADSVDDFLRDESTDFQAAVIVGGTSAISDHVQSEVRAAILGEPRPPAPQPSCPANSSPDCQYTYRHPIETWEDLAECESHQNWEANTGNGYYGGLQFSLGTWQNVGGQGYPHQNTKWEQIHRGEILQERAGWGQWPHCSRELGLR